MQKSKEFEQGWRRKIFLTISYLVISAPNFVFALANGVEIISSEYHVWGNISAKLFTYPLYANPIPNN